MDKIKFYEWARTRWSNDNTRRQYSILAKRLEKYWETDENDTPQLTQKSINDFREEYRNNRSSNNTLYKAFIKNYLECYQEELDKQGIKIINPKDRSRKPNIIRRKFLEKDEIDYLLATVRDKQLNLMLRLYFECGLRCSELLRIRREDINLVNRTLRGLGKGQLPFLTKFSPVSGELLQEWIGICYNPDYPFLFYTSYGERYPCKNQAWTCWYRIKKLGKTYGFVGEDRLFPHRIRHALGHFLRCDLEMDIVQIKEKLRHSSVNTTMIYVPATSEEVDGIIDEKVFFVESEKKKELEEKEKISK